jgi:hypothetical protein
MRKELVSLVEQELQQARPPFPLSTGFMFRRCPWPGARCHPVASALSECGPRTQHRPEPINGLHAAESFLSSQQLLNCSRNLSHFVVPESLLPCSHDHILSQMNPIPILASCFLKPVPLLPSHLCVSVSSNIFHSGCPVLCSFLRFMLYALPISFSMILPPDNIGEEYKLWSSSPAYRYFIPLSFSHSFIHQWLYSPLLGHGRFLNLRYIFLHNR